MKGLVITYWSMIGVALAQEGIDLGSEHWADEFRHVVDLTWGDPWVRYPVIAALITALLFKYWPWRKNRGTRG
jgi:hypothetical protein